MLISNVIFIVLRHNLTQAEVGPVHLDLFQLDVAHSVVDCILSCLFRLCITFNVGSSVSLFLYLVLCMCLIHLRFSRSFSPSLSYFE